MRCEDETVKLSELSLRNVSKRFTVCGSPQTEADQQPSFHLFVWESSGQMQRSLEMGSAENEEQCRVGPAGFRLDLTRRRLPLVMTSRRGTIRALCVVQPDECRGEANSSRRMYTYRVQRL